MKTLLFCLSQTFFHEKEINGDYFKRSFRFFRFEGVT
ncbi:hypothetical protein Pint_29169 [Pistacia integerrima]|uniref:Uncharacterized protein n=1 Tax=Pistacia integerrima TaxID=434235 RepID=A0ACC0X0B5_9ROSI|nr:hypothetical protein Pint_29169 [Pistacia integerrima]